MILKLKIKSNSKTNKTQLYVWIEKNKEFEDDAQQLIQFFKDQIQVKIKLGLHTYYKITSDNPAIMLSLLTAVQELIPDIYFSTNQNLDLEEVPQI
ncbi:MAG: hypothetical protein EAX91_12745 [Candidatus Lokiarchaeota archaeon]|nr:hypothetical protein [Candidatus Lokiarchaeota archaeon]